MPAQEPVLLAMTGICNRYPGVVALDAARLEVRRAEVHVLLGENGAGKSTLVKVLAGAVRCDAGTIEVEGVARTFSSPAEAGRAGVGIIYQEFNLIPHLSIAANLFLGREPRGVLPGLLDEARMHASAGALLRRLGLELDPGTPVDRLGVAEQQLVEIARALSVDARIMVMDEPTSALSDHEIDRLFSVIRDLRERGVAVIYISHRMEELFRIGDRVTIMRDGRTVGTRDLAATSMKELVGMMVGREVAGQFPKRRTAFGPAAVRVEGLRSRGRFEDVSFTLRRGEVLGFAGLLGSGRTAVARAVFGAERVDGGRIWVGEREAVIRTPSAAVAHGIGLLTEDRKRQGLVLGMDIAANTTLPSLRRFTTAGVVRLAAADDATARLVEELRVKASSLRQCVGTLSGGNQQKVVLAKWLCCDADVLLFDEPTRGIDVAAKAEIYELINRLAASGKAILLISSDLPEVLGMSDRVLVMHRGRVAGEFDPAVATPEQVLHCAFGARAA